MESSSAMVPFPLLTTPIESTYRPCTIPYRFASDSPRKVTPTELAWIEVCRKSIPSYRYGEILDELQVDPESHGGPLDCILLCRLREQCLRELGFRDVFKKVKDEENIKALTLFEEVVHLIDNIEDGGKRLENLIRGIFAGNIFDLGTAQLAEVFARDGISFLASCENLLPRPWVIDDLDAFKLSWMRKSWKKVILAANDLPSINDVTYFELVEIISKVKELKDGKEYILGVDARNLLIVNSGSDLPVIDLSNVSPELAYVASDADLVVLEGMGRAIETNLVLLLRSILSRDL